MIERHQTKRETTEYCKTHFVSDVQNGGRGGEHAVPKYKLTRYHTPHFPGPGVFPFNKQHAITPDHTQRSLQPTDNRSRDAMQRPILAGYFPTYFAVWQNIKCPDRSLVANTVYQGSTPCPLMPDSKPSPCPVPGKGKAFGIGSALSAPRACETDTACPSQNSGCARAPSRAEFGACRNAAMLVFAYALPTGCKSMALHTVVRRKGTG